MTSGRLAGKLDIGLEGDYPVTAQVTAERIDFNPFLVSALHLSRLNGHSLVDGQFDVAGFGARPETLAVEANLSRLTFDFENVKLENTGPVRLTYRRDEVRVEQANLRGTDTDFHISGSARFAGDRALNLRLDGAVSLQLLAGFMPQLEATGRAQINAAVGGTVITPRFNGKVHMEGASLRYGDFPAGLSNVAGDFNFDANRMVFDNVVAETGGGRLAIGGTVAYGEGPLNYVLNARTDQVRIRYPVGMSWLVGGTLRLSGNSQAATLSGRIVVDRLLMAEGFDLGSFMVSAKEPATGPSTTSSFLQNLEFDIQADSSPDSRMEWTGARLLTDASLRLRGTWEHPILLGHIHLLSGEMSFRGNQYTIARGDINFANPFRLDPVLNVEATTTIRQYEVTLDFTGPASRLTLAYRSDPAIALERHHRVACPGPNRRRKRGANRHRAKLGLGRLGASFRSDFQPVGRTYSAPVRGEPLQRRALGGNLEQHAKLNRQRNHRAASHPRPRGNLHHGHHHHAISSDSNRIHD